MKWLFLLMILLAAPGIGAWLKTGPRGAPWIWGLLGFLPFVIGPWHLFVAPYSTPGWPGYAKGWEVSLLDAVAVGILLGARGRWPRVPLLIPLLAYILAVTIAMYQAQFGKLAFSYVFQLLRVLVVFLAVARVAVSERAEKAVLTGLVAGLAVQAAYAIVDRAGGALQTGGSLGHQNLLGFVSHLVLMPAFAMFLAGRWPRVATVGLLSGVICVILTASRATIAFSGIGFALTLLISIAVRFTGRKLMLGGVAVLLVAASFPVAQSALDRRFQVQRSTFFTEDKEREAFAVAARAMISANPMGVGPNHYVVVANTQGYSARAGVSWATGSRSTNVHNSYLLVAAETGYFGLVTLLALLGSAIWLALSTAIRFRRQSGCEVLIGVGCGILAMSIHGLFEWMFVVAPTQYVLAALLGIITAIRSRYIRAAKREPVKHRARIGRVLMGGRNGAERGRPIPSLGSDTATTLSSKASSAGLPFDPAGASVTDRPSFCGDGSVRD